MIFKAILSLFLAFSAVSSANAFNLEVKNVETQELVSLLAKEANLNLILNGPISDPISVNLKQASALEALQAVLKLKNLKAIWHHNTAVVLSAKDARETLEEWLDHAYFTLKYLPVERAQKMLSDSGLISDLGKITADTNTNTLVVSDLTDNLTHIKTFVERFDKPTKQIIIEARIVSIDSSATQDLGLELGANLDAPSITIATKASDKRVSSDLTTTLSPLQPNVLTFTLAKLHDFQQLDLKLAALENDGLAKVISKPKLVTTDHQAASIETGTEIPYQEVNKKGVASITFKKAVLNLTVTPQLITSSEVNLNISLNQDKVGQLAVNGKPSIDTRKIQTQAVTKNHETIVLGGIYEHTSSHTSSKMPIVGDMPVIKTLFSRKTRRLEKRELLIFVTPHIVSATDRL